jgi:hypothetical protein
MVEAVWDAAVDPVFPGNVSFPFQITEVCVCFRVTVEDVDPFECL